jgi:hypothetical protein
VPLAHTQGRSFNVNRGLEDAPSTRVIAVWRAYALECRVRWMGTPLLLVMRGGFAPSP